ncbi:MAG: type II toxin-antitoxin system HicA family toxin [Burkholderiaceae bacterium]|nr:type II toxin-antitoxin system HicA family toxin [Burkholderiaceae bacterium]
MTSVYRQLTAVLKQHGYSLYRQSKGSHEYWCKNGCDCVSVPYTIKSRHTANDILKKAGIRQKI